MQLIALNLWYASLYMLWFNLFIKVGWEEQMQGVSGDLIFFFLSSFLLFWKQMIAQLYVISLHCNDNWGFFKAWLILIVNGSWNFFLKSSLKAKVILSEWCTTASDLSWFPSNLWKLTHNASILFVFRYFL